MLPPVRWGQGARIRPLVAVVPGLPMLIPATRQADQEGLGVVLPPRNLL